MRPLQAWAGRSEHAHLHSLARGQSHRAPTAYGGAQLQPPSLHVLFFCYLSFIRKLPRAPGWGVPPGAPGAGHLLSVPRFVFLILSSVHASVFRPRAPRRATRTRVAYSLRP